MFEVNPNINKIRFKLNADSELVPVEQLFFKYSKLISIKYENHKLIIKMDIHHKDELHKKELCHSVTIKGTEFLFQDAICHEKGTFTFESFEELLFKQKEILRI